MFTVDGAGRTRVDPWRRRSVRRTISFLNDLAFKAVFGTEKNKRLLIALLNALLELDDDDRIVTITLLNPFNLATTVDDKQSCVDVKAVDGRGQNYLIEVQMQPRGAFTSRVVYYLARLFADQLEAGARYTALCRATAISLVDFNLFAEHNEVQSRFRLCDPQHDLILAETLDLRFVELRKADIWPVSRVRTRFEKWLHMLKFGTRYPDLGHLPPALADEEEIVMSLEQLRNVNADSIARERLEAREKWLRDHLSDLGDAREEGLVQGRAEGRADIVRAMLAKGMAVAIVAELTGLSVAEIDTLRRRG